MKRSTLKRMIWWLVVAPVSSAIVFLGVLYLMQDRMVYHPLSEIEFTPADVSLSYEDVTFESSDGSRISAWYVPADDANAPVVLFCHGNGGNISDRLPTLDILHRLGLGVLIFDYRGYGASEGSPSEQGTYDDARAAWDWLVVGRGIAPGRIIVQGRSLGGSVAAWLAGEVSPAGLIIESTPMSIPEMGSDLYWYIPGFLLRGLCRYDYDTREHLKRVACPVLVMHSPDDELVPFSHGQGNFAAAGEAKRFVELTGGHNDAHQLSGEVYTGAVRAFVSRCLLGG
ncbi:MAG: alpha/beta hydrolase [Phycisphaerae bacterium]